MDLKSRLLTAGCVIEETDVRGDPIDVVTIGTILVIEKGKRTGRYEVVSITSWRNRTTVSVRCNPIQTSNDSEKHNMPDHAEDRHGFVVTFKN